MPSLLTDLPGRSSWFSDQFKNTNLVVEDVAILLPVKFCRISFSGFRGEVENMLANQRPGGYLGFPTEPKKNVNLVEDIENLPPVKFR